MPTGKFAISGLRVFGKGGGAKLAAFGETSLLGQIPLIQSVREAGDSGRPAVLQEGELKERFMQLAVSLHEVTSKRNQQMGPTRMVEIKTGL